MKILFLPNWSDNPYQSDLASALKKRGVTVIMGGRSGIDRLPILGAIGAHGKPTVLHLHWTHPYLLGRSHTRSIIRSMRFIVELFIVKLLGIKIIWTVHNLLDHEMPYPQLEFFFNRLLVRLYDRLIVHCAFAREAIIRTYKLPDHYRKKIHVVPHGSYIDTYENSLSRQESRAMLGLGERDIVLLYFGTIRPYKGVLRMTETFRKLQNPLVRLLIVGEPKSEAIKKELLKHCESDGRIRTFLKYVPATEVQIYMNAADVVVLPFQDILTSGSTLLAMSFGKPVIAPRIGCIPEVLDNRGAFLYDHNGEEGILKAIHQVFSANLAAMGKHNYCKAKLFDWNMIAQKTCALYQL